MSASTPARPQLHTTVLDAEDAVALARFYADLFGWNHADPPAEDPDWVTLVSPEGVRVSFQRVDRLPPSSWPTTEVPQQVHLDFTVPTVEDLKALHPQVLERGASLLSDESEDPEALL